MITLLLGASGGGKSTYVKNNILNSMLQNVIISPELNELKNKKTIETYDFDFHKFLKFYPNTIYILDDAFFLGLESEKRLLVLKEFFVRARKYNTHLVFIYHEAGQVPLRMFTYFTHVIAFKNETNINIQMQRLKGYEYMVEFFKTYNSKKNWKPHELIIHSRY